ncbi:MAG: cyclic nucleotide-binding domain-containing protein [Magnetococcales bacterium]|nr:cyclic nucleotide-binding domain-containing protein [Magnetococcales bacterium]
MPTNKLLDTISFFSIFSKEEKQLILDSESYFESFEPGEKIIEEGSTDSNLYILIKGKARVSKRDHPEHVLAVLGGGTVMGELSFLTRRPRSSDVTATEKVVCFTLNSETMAQLQSSMQHKIKDQLIEVLIGRLDDMNALYLNSLRQETA